MTGRGGRAGHCQGQGPSCCLVETVHPGEVVHRLGWSEMLLIAQREPDTADGVLVGQQGDQSVCPRAGSRVNLFKPHDCSCDRVTTSATTRSVNCTALQLY